MRRSIVALVLFALLALPSSARAEEFAAECRPADAPIVIKIGELECQRVHSDAVGGITAFTYWIPDGCRDKRCPVLYVLHGTSCSYGCVLGNVGEAAVRFGDSPRRRAWELALTSRPNVDDVWAQPDPWAFRDPVNWIPAPAIDMVMIAPHNRTVPGGYGPTPWTDGGWLNWNPKYSRDGAYPVYDTPPPLFETHVIHELIPWVEQHMPVGAGREYRAITGHSQGGLGAVKLGLQYPDVFSTFFQLSGASIPLGYTPAAADLRQTVPPLVAAPVAVPYTPLPGASAAAYPPQDTGLDPTGFVTALRGWFVGLGDPAVDEAYWRGNTSQDLAYNGRAWAGDEQSLKIDIYDGDGLNHNYGPDDVPNVLACVGCGLPIDYLEVFSVYIDGVQRLGFDSEHVGYTYRQFPGGHGAPSMFYRGWLETIYDRVRHADGTGSPPPMPDRFDYRSIKPHFDIWGWSFDVQRDPVEFLNIANAGCGGVTMQGSGTVTVTVPRSCGTGVDGSATFTVDLGPSVPADEHAMASYSGAYNHARTVELDAI